MGLVAMKAEENLQARIVFITESGQALLAAAAPHWAQAQQAVEELITPDEMDVFKKVLKKIESIRP